MGHQTSDRQNLVDILHFYSGHGALLLAAVCFQLRFVFFNLNNEKEEFVMKPTYCDAKVER